MDNNRATGKFFMSHKKSTKLIALYGKTISLVTLSHLADR
jgi:hypothetical protein